MTEVNIFEAINAAYIMFGLVGVGLAIVYLAHTLGKKNSSKKK